ncbi:receptor-type tyrosine-protein phosphatase-like N isoform X3 [Erythrolamprus reginae]|uniref:receptor-type tyrosine-protein phosphatase-like N isoform X3 n=1 Tax=Erythrolamprus reginae TaxID=121349 RepID=UPI00396C7105
MGRWQRLLWALDGFCLPLLLLPLLAAGTAGDRPLLQALHGCLFDRRLCSQQEVCVQDGLFGQCQESSLRDQPYFQVTTPVLQRLQDILRHLMAQGLSWQDDLTQYVIAQEMEHVPRFYLPSSWNSAAEDRLPPLHLVSRRPSLSSQPSSSAQGAHQPPLPPALLQRYLEVLLASQPELGHKNAFLSPYLHYQDSRSNLENRAESQAHSTEPDKLVQRLTAIFANYGIKPQDIIPFLQSPSKHAGRLEPDVLESKRVTEAEMQHGEGPEPAPSQEDSVSVIPTEGQIQALREAFGSTGGPTSMTTSPPDSHKPLSLSESDTRDPEEQVAMMKKSHMVIGLLRKDEEQPETPLVAEEYGYVVTDQKPLSLAVGIHLLETLAERVHLSTASFINISVLGPALTFRIRQNHQNVSLSDVANRAALVKSELESEVGVKILQMGVGQRNEASTYPHPAHFGNTFRSVLLTFVLLACVAGIVIAAAVVFCLRQHAKQREKERLAGLGPEGATDSTYEYQELCRQHMAAKSLFGRAETPPAPAPAENSRVSSVSSQFSDAPQASPSSHSSTPSWCEEPVQSNMDISTGHMILAYMEDHLRNRDRLAKEWQALGAYQAEPNTCDAAQCEANIKKNRNADYVPYDHARIKLKTECNPSRSDFINASPIIDHDPRMPAYIATQGPLSHTIADFWQMVWENGCTVIVMLTPLVEDGVKQCDRYWPDEGSSLYHIYEVNLVSEHIWCEDFLVRSFYLKNVQSQETRTLTQFHFLSWPAEGIPTTTRPLLDFRRKVNKCYRGRSCPIVVHCSDGAGRTGTYILIDMVLNRMAKGVKEIDIAATLEHVRDQRPGVVQTKDQFEFALTAVAEEVNAILKALPQ